MLSRAHGADTTKSCPIYSKFVHVFDQDSNQGHDREACRPPCHHWFQFFGQIRHWPFPWTQCLSQDPFCYAPIFSHKQVEGLGDIWETQAGAVMRAILMASKARCSFSPHKKGCLLLVSGYNRAAITANPGIHRRQKPSVPKNSRTCFWFVGGGMWNTVSLLASDSHLFPSLSRYPR
jgi:hypothetical protein